MSMYVRTACFIAFALLTLARPTSAAEPIVLTDAGRSDYRIVLDPAAPKSVRLAAEELQHYLQLATGAQLPIATTDADSPAAPLISLGDNAASRAAGLDLADVPVEGYRIVTRGQNLYILGPDTAADQHTTRGGTSTGTLNGVYAFLESELGIRWLMPGPEGEDVPRQPRVVLSPLDRIEGPGFANRRIPYIQNPRPEVQTWLRRNRQGFSLRLNHGHYWAQTIPPELFDQHPDWFAQIGGVRVPPVGRYKLETTNPELVRAYAERAAAALNKNPQTYSYSLSPTDSSGWSQSPESLALQEEDPHGKLSVTPMILKFYSDVARLVKEAAPGKAVAGYIYAQYLYPPKAGVPDDLPDNLYLILAPSFDYGYQLFRPTTQREFDSVFSAWASASNNIAYYDLPNQVSQDIGAPNAPALEILAFIYPRLVKYGVQGIYIYGIDAWGHGALTNYLLAKLNWDPTADPYALADTFYRRAYGPEAAPIIQQFYARLDAATKQFYLAHPDASYTLTPAMMQAVYADHYDELELLYLQAHAAAREEAHRTRLAMLGDNLALLQWNLRKRGMLKADPDSPLYRSDEQINALLADAAAGFALPPKAAQTTAPAAVDNVRVSVASEPVAHAAPPQPFLLRGSSRFLLYPLADEEVVIRAPRLTARGELVRFSLVDGTGQQIDAGVLTQGQSIRFAASERQIYLLDVTARSASYQLAIEGAPFAIKTITPSETRDLHLLAKTTPLYFYVPQGAQPFTLTLHSSSPGETAAADIVTPSGKIAASLDTSTQPVVRTEIRPAGEAAGFWAIRFKQPRSGLVDDVYVQLDESLSPWVQTDVTQPLIIQPVGR